MSSVPPDSTWDNPRLPSNFCPLPTVDEVAYAEAGGRRLMASAEAGCGTCGLGSVGGDHRRSPERKVSRQARGEGTQATRQGPHGRGETGEAGGSVGRGRGRRRLQVRGGRAEGLQLWCLGSSRAPDSRGSSGAHLSSPLPLPSEVPVVEHLLAVWIQGPVVAFTCAGREGSAQKIGRLTDHGVNMTNGGQLQEDSPSGPSISLHPHPKPSGLHLGGPSQLDWEECGQARKAREGQQPRILSLSKFKSREKAYGAHSHLDCGSHAANGAERTMLGLYVGSRASRGSVSLALPILGVDTVFPVLQQRILKSEK